MCTFNVDVLINLNSKNHRNKMVTHVYTVRGGVVDLDKLCVIIEEMFKNAQELTATRKYLMEWIKCSVIKKEVSLNRV